MTMRNNDTAQCRRSARRRFSVITTACIVAVFAACLVGSVDAKKAPSQAQTILSKGEPGEGGVAERTVPLRTHSIYAPYVDSDLQNRWFDFGGNAIINTNKHIRLTQDRKSQAGWLWSRMPLTPSAFEVEFEFRIDGKSNNFYGDGMAMWLTTDRAEPGPVFGSKDRWNGLGIMFDTYANSRHSYSFPQIAAIMNDGLKAYNLGQDGAGQEAGRCSLDFRRTEVTTKGKLTYFKNNFLELSIQHEEWDKWTSCFTIQNLTLPNNVYLGFTAHTGDVADEHDIISISAYNAVWHPPVPGAKGKKKRSTYKSGRKSGRIGSFLYVLIKWLFLATVVVVAFIVFRGYRSKKSAKRF